jgi:metallophosphoesterase (TIGR00282 family)
MKLLYIGDIMAAYGVQAVSDILPVIRSEYAVDVVIAQAENVSDGKGCRIKDFRYLQSIGIDGCSGGNHSIAQEELYPLLQDPHEPIIAPTNMPDAPGDGFAYIDSKAGKVLFISLLGHIVGKDANKPIDNPLQTIDTILASQLKVKRIATIVNFHGDFSSEKVMIGNYLDGRVSGVFGDHWHVPTADARVQTLGTAHITDVGMCGALESSLGVKFSSTIPRWRDGLVNRNELETVGLKQFNAVLVDINDEGLARTIEQIRKVW